MKLSPLPWLDASEAQKLLAALDVAKGATRMVGGSVRDGLLGLPVSDIDLATIFAPEEVMARLTACDIHVIPTGIAHGTVTAVLPGHHVEITTLRHDVSTDGRRATVAFTQDWQADAARRDFTINALYADPLTGEIFDYHHGLEDLKAHHVRFIGDAYARIAEDHLRILRFFRFHARFGGETADAQALAACTARANDLKALSRERIRDEVLKLLAVANPVPTVRLMVAAGIFTPVLPEVLPDAAERLETLVGREKAAAVAGDGLRRLSVVLPCDAALYTSLGARLRLSNAERKRIVAMASPPLADVRAAAFTQGLEATIDQIILHGRLEDLDKLHHWDIPRLPIAGRDFLALGLSAGPDVGRAVQQFEAYWVAAGFPEDAATVERLKLEAVAAIRKG